MKGFYFFDLDGTLADTDRDIREAWKMSLADLRLDCPDFDERFVTGPSIDEVVKMLFPDRWNKEMIADIRRLFGEHYDNDGFPCTREYPGVIERVKELKAAGARVFIATNKRFAGASAMGLKFGWNRIFERLYTGDMHKDDPIGKLRKPELLSLILREIGADPSDCVMVGDTVNDFEAANKNGIESVGVTWGYGSPAELSQATRIATTPLQI